MGHLIWGDSDWEIIRRHYNLPPPKRDDPITVVYTARGKCLGVRGTREQSTHALIIYPGALNMPNHLEHFGDVSTVFADLSDPHRQFMDTHAMSTSKKGCLWSLIRLYPSTCIADQKCVSFLSHLHAG